MNKKRWLVVISIVAAVALAIAYGLAPKPVLVEVSMAVRAPMMVTIDDEGKTRVKERFIITSPVAGHLRRVTLKAGDPVKRGKAVAEIEPLRSTPLDPRSRAEAEASVKVAGAAIKAAEEAVRAAEVDAGYAKSTLERTRKLYTDGYASKEALERAEDDTRKTEANLLSARANLDAARSELERARSVLYYPVSAAKTVPVIPPSDGRVLKVYKESEGVVNPGEPIIEIGDTSRIEARVEVLSDDAVSIRPGMKVYFDRWGGDFPLEGKVRTIEPYGFTKVSSLGVEEQRVLVIADIGPIPEGYEIGDGYRVEARFVIWEGKDVLQVPASALFRAGEGWAVFVVIDGRANIRAVEVGRKNGLSAEIFSGLSEGEAVVMHPEDSVSEGTRVRIR